MLTITRHEGRFAAVVEVVTTVVNSENGGFEVQHLSPLSLSVSPKMVVGISARLRRSIRRHYARFFLSPNNLDLAHFNGRCYF